MRRSADHGFGHELELESPLVSAAAGSEVQQAAIRYGILRIYASRALGILRQIVNVITLLRLQLNVDSDSKIGVEPASFDTFGKL